MEVPSDVGVTLARIEIKLDEACRIGGDHEVRLRALENSRWPLPTVSVLMSVAAAAIAAVSLLR